MLEGAPFVGGAKAASSALLGLGILSGNDLEILRPPRSPDWHEALEVLGDVAGLTWDGRVLGTSEGVRRIVRRQTLSSRLPLNLAGILAVEHGRVSLPSPTGCALGDRPIDEHTAVLRSLGLSLDQADGRLECVAGIHQTSRSVSIGISSSGASTQALLVAAALGGHCRIDGLAPNLEVRFLLEALAMAGRARWGSGPDRRAWAEIVPGNALELRSIRAPLDAIEVGCWVIAGLLCSSSGVDVAYEPSAELDGLLEHLKVAGATIDRYHGRLLARAPREGAIDLGQVSTAEGVHTDYHAALACLATAGDHPVDFHDGVFPNRSAIFRSIADAAPSGAIEIGHGRWRVNPCEPQIGTRSAPDIRAGFGLLLLALRGQQPSRIVEAQRIVRGFPMLVENLHRLGVSAELVEEATGQ